MHCYCKKQTKSQTKTKQNKKLINTDSWATQRRSSPKSQPYFQTDYGNCLMLSHSTLTYMKWCNLRCAPAMLLQIGPCVICMGESWVIVQFWLNDEIWDRRRESHQLDDKYMTRSAGARSLQRERHQLKFFLKWWLWNHVAYLLLSVLTYTVFYYSWNPSKASFIYMFPLFLLSDNGASLKRWLKHGPVRRYVSQQSPPGPFPSCCCAAKIPML